MKKSHLWIIALVTVIVSSYCFYRDELINPQIQPLIEDAHNEITLDNNGMVYLLGMFAANEAPYTVGLRRIENFKSRRGQSIPTSDDPLESIDSDYWLPKLADSETESSLFCHYLESEYLQYIWANTEAIPALLDTNRIYIDRLEQLMQFEKFSPPIKPDISAPQIFHSSTLSSVKLKLLEVIYLAKHSEITEASIQLQQLIRLNINLLNSSPGIMTKVIASVQHEISLEVAAFLLKKTSTESLFHWQPMVSESSRLKPESMSLLRPLMFDYIAVHFAIQNISSAKRNWFDRLTFKPNMTANLLYDYYLNSADLYSWNDGLIKANYVTSPRENSPNTQFTNYTGSKLVQLAAPRFLDIEDNFLEVYLRSIVLQQSFNHRSGETIDLENNESLFSPYTGKRAYRADDKLCVERKTTSEEPLCFYF